MQPKRFIPLICFVVFTSFFWWALDESRDIIEIPTPLIGKKVAPFQLPLLDNPAQQMGNEQLQGQVTLLNFWGSWCFVCVQEHPLLRQLASQGVNILGINYRDDRNDAREWLEKHGNPYQQVLADSDGRFAIELGVYGAPETYLVDKNGTIRYKQVGIVNTAIWRDEIEPLYRQLLSETAQ